MSDRENILDRAITVDLFGPDALTEAAEVEVPDKYEVQECLGRGGFGVVYKARDRDLDRPVALKLLTDARRTDLERFRREARFAARLNNPSIVQVYEFGEHNGQPFIAMQYIDGVNLADADLKPEEILRSVGDVAKALQHAHEEGIVHRDFKPANVLRDWSGRTFLTDFGIARDLCGSNGATLSEPGSLMGTPALMSPEQARGELQSIDARSDIYAVGASLFLLLCRRYPFEQRNLGDVLHSVMHEEPPLPRSINPSIPRSVEAVIIRCMRKDRSLRYSSMAELATDLDAILSGGQVASESNDWFRRMVGAGPPPSSPSDLLESVGLEVSRELAAWDANLYRVSRNISRFFPQLDGIIERLTTVIKERPHVAWARFYRGMALFRRNRLDEALDDMERSIDRLANQASAQYEMGRLYLTLFLREQQCAHKHLSRVGTDHHLADWRGRLDQAVVCFEETQRLKSDLLRWQIDFATAASRLADEDYQGCITMCDRILTEDPDLEEVWKLRGDALRMSGGDPFESYDEAIRIRRSDCDVYIAKAEAYLDRSMLDEARDCLNEALDVYPDCVDALCALGMSFLKEARECPPDGDASVRRAFLDKGLHYAELASESYADCYDAAATRAELLIELAKLSRDPQHLETALAVLNEATRLRGCQNRISYLTAVATLERARLRQELGEDPLPDLRAVLAYENDEGVHVPDAKFWRSLLEEARRELAERN